MHAAGCRQTHGVCAVNVTWCAHSSLFFYRCPRGFTVNLPPHKDPSFGLLPSDHVVNGLQPLQNLLLVPRDRAAPGGIHNSLFRVLLARCCYNHYLQLWLAHMLHNDDWPLDQVVAMSLHVMDLK